MAQKRAHKLVSQLVDDPDINSDDPEAYAKSVLLSPIEHKAKANGFTQDNRTADENRWVKPLSDGREAWLVSQTFFDEKEPDYVKGTGGKEWSFVMVTPIRFCQPCIIRLTDDQEVCPNCQQKTGIISQPRAETLVRLSEPNMFHLLSAIQQRLDTWPKGMKKPGEKGFKGSK